MKNLMIVLLTLGSVFILSPAAKAADAPAQTKTNFSSAAPQSSPAVSEDPADAPAASENAVLVPADLENPAVAAVVPAVAPAVAPSTATVPAPSVTPAVKPAVTPGYQVGIDDELEISILQPESLIVTSTVAPDGTITFPYIGNVAVKGLTLGKIQDDIQAKLADGYMKYPVVSVSLKVSRSRKFFIYGEVIRPGTYFLEENERVLQAISMAGGFTRFGSTSRVKVLRRGPTGTGVIKINIKAIMNGDTSSDIILKPGDTVVVEEGAF